MRDLNMAAAGFSAFGAMDAFARGDSKLGMLNLALVAINLLVAPRKA